MEGWIKISEHGVIFGWRRFRIGEKQIDDNIVTNSYCNRMKRSGVALRGETCTIRNSSCSSLLSTLSIATRVTWLKLDDYDRN